MEPNAATIVFLNDVRFSFCHVHEPYAHKPTDKPKYQLAFLLAKDHPGIALVRAAMLVAAEGKWGAKYPDVVKALKASDRLAYHDGDIKAAKYADYAGLMYINSNNATKPAVFGPDPHGPQLTMADGKPYSGCYGNAKITIWAQDNEWGQRLNAELNGVQFVRDGERMSGGGVAAADDFQAIPEEVENAFDEGHPAAQVPSGGMTKQDMVDSLL